MQVPSQSDPKLFYESFPSVDCAWCGSRIAWFEDAIYDRHNRPYCSAECKAEQHRVDEAANRSTQLYESYKEAQ